MKKILSLIIIFLFFINQSPAHSFKKNILLDKKNSSLSLFEKRQQKSEKLISLNFRDIAIRDLINILARFSRKNIIVDDSVSGNITINLNNVTWLQALKIILNMKHLKAEELNRTIFISPVGLDFAALSATQFTNINQVTNTASTQELFMPLHYAKANEIAEILAKSHDLLSPSSSVIADNRTNSLWIKAEPWQLKTVYQYIKNIDIPAQEVLIEARIVYADESFVRELGLEFGTSAANSSNQTSINMDLPNSFNPGEANIAIAKLGGGTMLDLELTALESEGRGKVISRPKLLTLNRESAYIESGDEVPYQEKTSSGATSVTFKKAVLGLKVTPEITTTDKINLKIVLNQDKVSAININGEPAIQTRQIETEVLVKNGQTVVLGGIYEESNSHNITRVPFLGAIPLIGELFQKKLTQVEQKELLIFVTPKICQET